MVLFISGRAFEPLLDMLDVRRRFRDKRVGIGVGHFFIAYEDFYISTTAVQDIIRKSVQKPVRSKEV